MPAIAALAVISLDDDFGYGPHYQFRFSTSTPGVSWLRTVL